MGEEMPMESEQLAAAFTQNPYPVYERLRAESPVVQVRLPRGLAVWLVTRYDDVRAALASPQLHKDYRRLPELYAKHFAGGATWPAEANLLISHMLNTDPPDHERLRRLVSKAFTAGRSERMRPRIEEIATGLASELTATAGTPVDLLENFAIPLPIIVICEMLGVPPADRGDFRNWARFVISGGTPEQMESSLRSLIGYLMGLIEAKRQTAGEDMLSALVHAHDVGDQLTGTELVSTTYLLMTAAYSTVVDTIGNAVLALLENPEQLAAVLADPALIPAVVDELLRYMGPVNNATLRFTAEPTQIGETLIPGGEFVLLSLASANRDLQRFTDPHQFDLARDPGGHLAFGYGVHYCLGAQLGKLEGEIGLHALLTRFSRIELAVPADDLRWRSGIGVRGLQELPVVLG